LFRIRNVGSEPLHFGAWQLHDEAAADFGYSETCGAQLEPNGICLVTVTLTPSSTGERRAVLVIPNDSDERTSEVLLAGQGRLAPSEDLTPVPATLVFDEPLNTRASLPLDLRNTGAVPVAVNSVGGTVPGVTVGKTCDGTRIDINRACVVEISFAAQQPGRINGQLRIGYGSGKSLIVPVTAVAQPTPSPTPAPPTPSPTAAPPTPPPTPVPTPAPVAHGELDVDPKAVFLRQQPGRPEEPATVQVINNGNGFVRQFTSAITKGGDSFSLGSKCGPQIPPGASCALYVRSVSIPGTYEGTLVLSSSEQTIAIPLAAEISPAGKPAVEISPKQVFAKTPGAPFNFMALFPGVNGTVTLKNKGTANLEFTRFDESPEATFTISQKGLKHPCDKELAPGDSCQIHVNLNAGAASTKGTLYIFDNASDSPQTVTLVGEAPEPPAGRLTITPNTLDFGKVAVIVSGIAQTGSHDVTLRNTGSGDLQIRSIIPPSDQSYTLRSHCGVTLAPSASCMVQVYFQPRTTGAHWATISIKVSGAKEGGSVSLRGEGIAATQSGLF
jgi:hypothetical protein